MLGETLRRKKSKIWDFNPTFPSSCLMGHPEWEKHDNFWIMKNHLEIPIFLGFEYPNCPNIPHIREGTCTRSYKLLQNLFDFTEEYQR